MVLLLLNYCENTMQVRVWWLVWQVVVITTVTATRVAVPTP
jgi:hypothetical protein